MNFVLFSWIFFRAKDLDFAMIIIDKKTNELVANSMGFKNFEVIEDGKMIGIKFENFGNESMKDGYIEYLSTGAKQFEMKSNYEKYHFNIEISS